MPTKVTKLGFIGLDCVKSDAMKHHYQNILGLPVSSDNNRESYFACGSESYTVSLHRSDRAGFRHVGFQIEGSGPLDDALSELKAAGIKASLKSDSFFGIASCIEIADPDGYVVTNNHVIDRARQISVQLLDGQKYEAELISADSEAEDRKSVV